MKEPSLDVMIDIVINMIKTGMEEVEDKKSTDMADKTIKSLEAIKHSDGMGITEQATEFERITSELKKFAEEQEKESNSKSEELSKEFHKNRRDK